MAKARHLEQDQTHLLRLILKLGQSLAYRTRLNFYIELDFKAKTKARHIVQD